MVCNKILLKPSTGWICNKSKNKLGSLSKLEYLELISSMFNTLFVFAWIKSVKLTFCNWINFEVERFISKSVAPVPTKISLALSKLYKVSTLTLSINDGNISKNIEIFACPPIGNALDADVIPVSEKFLNPAVWTKLFTGLFKSFHVIGLCMVYERFW